MTIAMTLACVCLVRAPAPAVAEDAAKRAYLEAWYAETAEQDPEKALAAYRKVIEANGTDRVAAMARLRIGFCLRSLGKEDDARAAFQEVIDKNAAEGDLAARARRMLAGETEESMASLPIADPRAEVLAILDAMIATDPGKAGPEDLKRFLAVLRLSTPEYVREVVLVKDPAFGTRATVGIRPFLEDRTSLPDADLARLLMFCGVPELRAAVFTYIGLRGDRSIIPEISALLDSADVDLRSWAAYALGELNVPEAAPKILGLFREEKDAARAVQALGWIGTPEAIQALRPFLFSSDDDIRRLSWEGMRPPREGDGAARILKLGLASDNPSVLLGAFERLADWIAYPNVQEAILPGLGDLLVRLAELKSSANPRNAAYQILARAKGDTALAHSTAPLFRRLLMSPLADPAIEFFQYHWQEFPDLLDILRNGPADLRGRIMAALRNKRDPILLSQVAGDPGMPPDVRVDAAQSCPSSFPSLLGDADPRHILATLDVLVKPRRPFSLDLQSSWYVPIRDAVRLLLQAAGDAARPTAVRSAAIETLAKLEDWEGCLIALRDPVPHIRMSAANRLLDFDPAYVRVAEMGDPVLERRFLRHLQECRVGTAIPPQSNSAPAWHRRLESLYASKHEAFRRQVIELLLDRREKIPQELGIAFARKAFKDPSIEIRRVAARALDHWWAWDDLLSAWDDLVRLEPSAALRAADKRDRMDRIESLRSHQDPSVAEAAEGCLYRRAKPEEIPSFLSSPFPDIRCAALEKLVEAHDLVALAPALGDENTHIAETAYRALAGVSGEVSAKLANPRGAEFVSLDVNQRRAIAEALIPWLRSRGNAIWIGRAEELLREYRERSAMLERISESERKKIGAEALTMQEEGTRLLCAALPDPTAIEILVSRDDIRTDIAAAEFARLRLIEPLKRLTARLRADPKGEPLQIEILEALARIGEVGFACTYIAERLNHYKWSFSDVVEASGDAGPEGPLPFLTLLSQLPERTSEAKALVTAFRAVRSTEGVRRALAELPAPPFREAFDALIALGDPEPVLQQALEGEFWYEAATALRDATGGWFGFFGADWIDPAPPLKRGILGFVRPGMPASRDRPQALDPEARQAAVNAWRKALEKRASGEKRKTP